MRDAVADERLPAHRVAGRADETGRPSVAADFSSARSASSHASPVTCAGRQWRATGIDVEPAGIVEDERRFG